MNTRPSNYDLIKLGIIDHPLLTHKLTLHTNPECTLNRGFIEITVGISQINQLFDFKFTAHPYPDKSIIDDPIQYQKRLKLSAEKINLLFQEIKNQLDIYSPPKDYFSEYRILIFDQDIGCGIYEKSAHGLNLVEEILLSQFLIMKNHLIENIKQPTSNLSSGCRIL